VSKLPFTGRGILLDIEGTTSPIAFVYDVLFPYARARLETYFEITGDSRACREVCEQIARDAGHASVAAWRKTAGSPSQYLAIAELRRLMDADAKTTGLKAWQGLVWEQGYRSGELVSELFDDVPPALHAWRAEGRDVRIYSSGSADAQKLFFGHTRYGDLLPFLRGHYDTTIGPKRESASYERIAAQMELPPSEVLFASDVSAELDAARDAGLATVLVVRPGNPPQPDGHGHAEVRSLAEIG
jgi:enolase-phosphatase E1